MKHLPIISLIALLLAACARSPEYRTAAGSTWGTTYHITYNAERDLSDSIIEQMRLIDMSLSPFVDSSLLSRINRGEDSIPDALISEVFCLSQRVCSISGGAFDPTLAPLINLWGFGYKNGTGDPTDAQIDSAMALVGIMDCAIDSLGALRKKSPGTAFNFSAIAKGYGVDKIAEMLRRNGCVDYMVEVGGEVALSGKNSHGEDWHIQVDAPMEDKGEVQHNRLMVIPITDLCMATSGNYRNYRETSKGKAGHTISAVTGRPITTGIISATIIAPTCAYADALATATMAMPDSSAQLMLRSLPDIQAILVLSDSTVVEINR